MQPKSTKILIGSQVFFSKFPDYQIHDTDYVVFDENPILYKDFMAINGKGCDEFHYRNMTKEEFIKYELSHCTKDPLAAGKFLIPDLCDYLNITIGDLKLFESAFRNIDEKHKYEEVIYDSYIENGGFWISEEQLNEAWKVYNKYR